jgi:hypothetical protein
LYAADADRTSAKLGDSVAVQRGVALTGVCPDLVGRCLDDRELVRSLLSPFATAASLSRLDRELRTFE